MGDDAMILGTSAQRVKSCLDVLNLSCQLKLPVVSSYVVKGLSSTAGDRDVLQHLAMLFGFKDPSEFSSFRSFSEMGMDSMIRTEIKHYLETTCEVSFSIQEIQELKIDDVKALLEKAEARKKNAQQSNAFVSTGCADLPQSFFSSEPIKCLNNVQRGTPVVVLDIDSGDLDKFRALGGAIKRPTFALLLTKDAPTTSVSALASWFLEKIRGLTDKEVHVLAHRCASVVALEMVLQTQNSSSAISNLSVLDGITPLLESVTRDSKKSEIDIFCDFVERYIPSAHNRIREQLSNTTNFQQKLRFVVDLFTKSSKEAVNKTELSDVISSHIKKLQILEEYEPKAKLVSDLLVIEDSSELLPNDVAEVKKVLTEASTGKVTIQRVPGAKNFCDESVPKIAAALARE